MLAEFGIDVANAPSPNRYETLVRQATRLMCQEISAVALPGMVTELRERAGSVRQVNAIAKRMADLFGLSTLDDRVAPTVDLAVDALRQASRDMLLARKPELTSEQSALVVAQLDARVRAVREQRAQLAQAFDLPAEMNVDQLRQAARDLEHSRAPAFLNRRIKQATRLHRSFRRGREKLSRTDMVNELRQIADYYDAVAQLHGDPDAMGLFGQAWRGHETDLNAAVAVVSVG